MADMNSYIASYCSRTGMSFDEATSKMESLRNNFRHDDDLDSIWEYKANEELTFEDFTEMMDKGAGASLSDADVEFLFDLFNKDGEGGISGEELSIIVGNKGVVTDFKIWGVLNNGDEKTFKEIQENKYLSLTADQLKDDGISAALKEIYTADEISKLENGEAIERKTLTSDEIDNLVGSLTDADLEDYKAILTPESYEELITAYEAKAGENTSGTDDVTGTGGAEGSEGSQGAEGAEGAQGGEKSEDSGELDLTDPDQAKEFLKTFADEQHKTYEEVITYLLDAGIISEEQAETITTTLNKSDLSPADQAKLDAAKKANPGKSDAELMEMLGLSATDSSGVQEAAFKEIDVDQWAEDLYKAMKGAGTDESQLKAILNDDSITDEQFAKVVEAYENKYGVSLVTRLEQETSGSLQTELTSVLGSRLMEAASAGDETAIDMICKNLYSGTAGQNCTADDFLAAIFTNNADLETIYKINERYSELNNNRDLIEDIRGDHGGFLNWRNWGWNVEAGGKGQDYIELIQKAKRQHVD